jgi:Phage integrase family.
MEKDGCSSTLIRYTQRVFQQALKSAIKEGKTVPEGVIMFERPDAEVSDRTAIPLPDSVRLAAMAASIKADPAKGIQDGSRWIAALLQGMRQGECLGLTWDNVDFEKNVIVVRWQLQELPYKDRAAGTFQLPPGLEVRHLTERFHLTPPKSRRGYRVIPMVEPMRDAMLDWRDRWPENSWNLVWAHPSIT